MNGDLLDQGLALMLYGMGTVFVFLSLLVVMTYLMSWIILRYFPEAHDKPEPEFAARTPQAVQTPVAVIAAAIHRYRTKHKK